MPDRPRSPPASPPPRPLIARRSRPASPPCAVVEVGDARRRPRPDRRSAGCPAPPTPRRRTSDTIFDLGVADQGRSATTLLAMRLEDAGRCAMTDRVGRWWPAWYGPGRDDDDARRPARARLRPRRAPAALRRPPRRGRVRRRDLPHAARGPAARRRRCTAISGSSCSASILERVGDAALARAGRRRCSARSPTRRSPTTRRRRGGHARRRPAGRRGGSAS